MNILEYREWLRINLFNLLGDFDGHWTVYLNKEIRKYLIGKFGNYESLTSYEPVDLRFVRLSKEQEDFINERIEKRICDWKEYGNKLTDISDDLWNDIYDDERKLIDGLVNIDPSFLNQYNGIYVWT